MIIYHLYKKTHNITNLNYLGITEKDPIKYYGSGLYWLRHLKKYGKEISTEIIGSYNTIEELNKNGLYYSKLWNIVESDEWANLIEENGYGGGCSKGKHPSEETKQKIREANLGHMVTPETRQKISEKRKLQIFPPESNYKRSIALKGNKNALGNSKPKSQEHKQKMSIARKKWWKNKKQNIT